VQLFSGRTAPPERNLIAFGGVANIVGFAAGWYARAQRPFLRSPGRRRESSYLVKKGKPVGHPPMFDKFSVRKSTDVHDIDGDRLA